MEELNVEDVKWDNRGTAIRRAQREQQDRRIDRITMPITQADKFAFARWATSVALKPIELLEFLLRAHEEGRLFIVDQENLLTSLRNHLIDAAREEARREAERYLHQALYEKGITDSPFRR
jgi:hypothetical protein